MSAPRRWSVPAACSDRICRALALVLALIALCTLAAGCGSKHKDEGASAADSASPGALPSLLANGPVEPALLVPAEAMFHARVPAFSKLVSAIGFGDPLTNPAFAAIWEAAAKQTSVPAAEMKKLCQSFEGAAVWGTKDAGVGLVARYGAGLELEPWLARAGFSRADEAPGAGSTGSGTASAPSGYSRWQTAGNAPQTVLWFPTARMAIWASSAALADQALGVARKQAPSWASSPGFPAQVADSVWARVDLGGLPLGPASLDAGSEVTIELGGKFALDAKLLGARLPRVGTVLPPMPPKLLDKLPEETVSAFELSLARAPGKTLENVIMELLRVTPDASTAYASLQAALASKQVSIAELDEALGDAIAFGGVLVSSPTAPPALGQPFGAMGAIALLDVRDDAKARRLFDLVKGEITKGGPGAKVTPTSLELVAGNLGMRMELRPGMLVLAGVERPSFPALLDTLAHSKGTLADRPGYRDVQSQLAAPAQLRMWADFSWIMQQAGQGEALAGLGLFGSNLKALAMRVVMPDEPRGLHLQWTSDNVTGAAAIGTMSTLAIYGVRRYLANAKTAEAKNTLGEIARDAAAAYEREGAGGKHALCESATPVPANLSAVAGRKYQASAQPGADFQSGSDGAGWRCLRFSLPTPQYFQYEYVVGPGRASAIDPARTLGAGEFEAIARGDLDGDGTASLFVRSGKATAQGVTLAPELYVANEFE
jgi:type IV pilus assembly protein PilA